MKREHISITYDPRNMLPSLQIGFKFVKAAVACAILIRTSGFEPLPETIAPRYLKLETVPNVYLLNFTSLLVPFALFVIRFVFLAFIFILYLVQVMCRLSTSLLFPAFLQQEDQCHRQTADWEQLFRLYVLPKNQI